MISQFPPTAPDSAPDHQPRGRMWYRWIDGTGGLVLLAAGILGLCWSTGPHQRSQLLVAVAVVLTALLDLLRWFFEGHRWRSLPGHWRIVLWASVFVLLLAGGLGWHLGY